MPLLFNHSQVEPNSFRPVMNSELVSLQQSIEENLYYFINSRALDKLYQYIYFLLLKENAENDQPDLEVGRFKKGKVDNDDDTDDERLFVCFGVFKGSIDHHSSQNNEAPFLTLPRLFLFSLFHFLKQMVST